jgi:hypothetical protein
LANQVIQYKAGKDNLYYFYRFIVLRWELEWSAQNFLIAEGDLQDFCYEHKISIKQYPSTAKLNEAISKEFEAATNKYDGLIWFIAKDTKPKDALRHLRNTFAHGNFRKRQKNGVDCIVFENIDKKLIKAKGYIPLKLLKPFVEALVSCRVD